MKEMVNFMLLMLFYIFIEASYFYNQIHAISK